MNDLIISLDAGAHRGRRLEYFRNRLEQPGGPDWYRRWNDRRKHLACRFRNRQRRSPMQAMPSYKPTCEDVSG